jgi:hydrogenase maturation protease
VFDAGSAPENYGERIAALAPDAVLVVDAARFGGEPGEARMLCPDEITGKGLSTHDQSLGALARYLAGRCGCGMRILGIEPASSEMDSDLSPPVKTMLDELEPFLLDYLP